MNCINYDEIVRKYNLSPLEKIMLSFDLVREKRDNCYNEFERLLYNQNIKVFNYHLFGNRVSHSRSAIFLNDEKYNIDGIYFFDLNWSLKKDDNDESYKYIYNYFAKSKDYFDDIDCVVGLKDYIIGDFASLVDNFHDVALYDNLKEVNDDDIDSIEFVSSIVDNNLLKIDKNKEYTFDELYKIYEKINQYDLLLSKKIPGEVYLEALYEVTKIKYLENIDNNMNYEYFKYTFYNSNWHFSEKSIYNRYRCNHYYNEDDRFLANICNIENIGVIFDTIDYYSANTGFENKINEFINNTKKIKVI